MTGRASATAKLRDMRQYLLLIHHHSGPQPDPEAWERFFELTARSGLFRGGSEIGKRELIGGSDATVSTTDHLVGYMRFDAEDKQALTALLAQHPVVRQGGTVELCELPES